MTLLLTLVSLLGKRTVNFLSHLLPIIVLIGNFVLAWQILPSPSILQLAGLSIFAAFSIVLVLIRK